MHPLSTLRAFLRAVEPTQAFELLGADLSALLPELGVDSQPADNPRQKHERVVESLVRLLTGLGSRHSVVLLIEDMHRADSISLEVALSIFEALGEDGGVAQTLDLLALAAAFRAELAEAVSLWDRAIACTADETTDLTLAKHGLKLAVIVAADAPPEEVARTLGAAHQSAQFARVIATSLQQRCTHAIGGSLQCGYVRHTQECITGSSTYQ